MTTIEIRRAAAEDVAEIEGIARAAYAGYVPFIGREPAPMVADFAADVGAGCVDIAVSPGRAGIAGYIVHRAVSPTTWLLENVAVAPTAQGLGVGLALIAHAEQIARAAGATEITLYTHVKMEANQAFYRRLGYDEIRRAEEDGFHRVFFRKPL